MLSGKTLIKLRIWTQNCNLHMIANEFIYQLSFGQSINNLVKKCHIFYNILFESAEARITVDVFIYLLHS